MQHRRRLLHASLSVPLLGMAPFTRAQVPTYPRGPIRIIVPFAAGSGTDLTAREIGQRVGEATGWNFIVDNKAGANGFIAIQELMRAAPDGQTLIMTGNTTHAANPALFKKLPYDPLGDFAPISRTGVVPLVLFVAAKHGVRRVADLVELARKQPGRLSFATGSASHRLAAELFRQRAGLQVNHVPYKGSAQALTDLIGGHVDFMFVDTAVAMSYIKAGSLHPLAVTSLAPLEALPQVPTMVSLGFEGFQVSGWSAFFAPRRTPADIVLRLNQAFSAYILSPAGKQYTSDRAGYSEPLTPEQTGQWVRAEIESYRKTFQAAGIEPE